MATVEFTPSKRFTVGVELELQLVNTRDYDLATDAQDLLRALAKVLLGGGAKPEITQSMLEINSSAHARHDALLTELSEMRTVLAREARRLNLAVSGGGAHPFQHWHERRIYPSERFQYIHAQYGFLAKQFTVFGQHVHVGCANGDEAIYLAHALGRFVPHFIALAASSPYYQGVDTAFESSRVSVVNAFPLAGVMPFVHNWEQFLDYFAKMTRLKVVESMKDFYWDIRPKPEYGTVEVRVFDTPLTVQHAATLAAYVQVLACYLIEERPLEISSDQYLLYNVNRFQAARFGFQGELIDPYDHEQRLLRDDIAATLRRALPHAKALGTTAVLEQMLEEVTANRGDSEWQRKTYEQKGSLNDLVREQTLRWMGEEA